MADTTKKIIRGVVNGRGFTITSAITQWDYGWQFIPEIENLPATYRLDFSNDEHHGTALPVYCSTEGAEVPTELIDTGKDVWVWFVRIGDGYGITEYKWRVPNKCKPKTEQDEPTPSQQSSIDQLIVRSNEAVTSAEQSASEADQSAQSAREDADRAEEARTDAQNYATQAQTSANNASASASQASTSATASAQSASASAQIKADVEDLVDDAQGYAQASAQSASASANSASQASGYAQSASASAQSASTSASDALTYTNTASGKASEASTSAQTASQKATEASQSATNASQSAQTAEQAKTASQTAQGLAESARDSAVSAKTDAESARDDAETARDEAQQAVASISGALIEKAPVITDTASGSIASFSDGADDLPLKSLIVDINPVQDLHGYDSPWPAGGGKNLINLPNVAETTKSGVTYSISNGVVSINGTCNSGFAIFNSLIGPFPSDSYTASVNLISGTASTINNSFNFYDSENTRKMVAFGIQSQGQYPIAISFAMSIVKADIVINNGAVFNNAKFSFQLEKGSSATSFAPYENLCPISGWTEVNVEQRGVNVWDEEWELGGLNATTGAPAVATDRIRSANYIPILPNTTYYASIPSGAFFVYFYDKDKNHITPRQQVAEKAFTTPSNALYMRWNTYDGSGASSQYGTTYNHDISINYPSTDHSYHPYTGRSITINLGQTVYGGKLDVLSGDLVIDRAMVDLGTLNWAMASAGALIYQCSPSGMAIPVTPPYTNRLIGAICSMYPPSTNVSISTSMDDKSWIRNAGNLYIRDTSYADVVSFKTAMSGVQLVYELATPLEIQLSANQLNSLYGVNNLWADSGDTEVEYRADTKLFIERLTAPDSADMIADANITSGQYFMVGNSLYKATANIANGSAIVVGTNCIRKSLSEALNEINV